MGVATVKAFTDGSHRRVQHIWMNTEVFLNVLHIFLVGLCSMFMKRVLRKLLLSLLHLVKPNCTCVGSEYPRLQVYCTSRLELMVDNTGAVRSPTPFEFLSTERSKTWMQKVDFWSMITF